MKTIRYRKGYKYQLTDVFRIKIDFTPLYGVELGMLSLSATGDLFIRENYAWDGPSGPAIDTSNFMRASLVHDALYQLIRSGQLGVGWRKKADEVMYRLCREDGMSWIRSQWVYRGVRIGGAGAADPKNVKTVYVAP